MILGGVTLPNDLYWSDEHRYTPVQSSLTRSLTGVAIVAAQSIPNGRPVTLEGSDERAWIRGVTLDSLEALAAVPSATYTWLHADGRQYNVRFRHHDTPVIEAQPILFTAPLDQMDWFQVRLKLMIV